MSGTDLFADVIGGAPSATLAAIVSTTPAAGTVETWTITFSGTWPAIGASTGQIDCLIDSEIVSLTAGTASGSSQSITVTRGTGGTIAAHSVGASLTPVVDAEGLANMLQLSPSAAQSGNLNVSGTGTFGGNVTAPNLITNPISSPGDFIAGDQSDAPARLAAYLAARRLANTGTDGTRLEGLTRGRCTGNSAPTAGWTYLVYFDAPINLTISSIGLCVGGTAAVYGTGTCYVGLFSANADGSLNSPILGSASAATGTTFLTTANTTPTLALGANIGLTAGTRYAIGVLFTAGFTTLPTLMGMTAGAGQQMLNLQPVEASITGGGSAVALPTLPLAAGSLSRSGLIPYCWVA